MLLGYTILTVPASNLTPSHNTNTNNYLIRLHSSHFSQTCFVDYWPIIY